METLNPFAARFARGAVSKVCEPACVPVCEPGRCALDLESPALVCLTADGAPFCPFPQVTLALDDDRDITRFVFDEHGATVGVLV